MRVLFVDDEPRILEAMQRKLFHRCDDWEIECAESGAEALDELAEEDYDVVVSDMRMPGMDGAELLTRVQELYPRIVRIILSGHAELEAAMRAVPVTHQFLAKPCEPEVIEHVICRAVELNELLVAPELRELVGEVKKMPSLPGVYSELTAVMADPDCSLGAVTDVVVKDPAMCAKLLQLVNSAFFSRGAEIADVRAAVMRLGIELVKNLALAAEVFSATTLPRSLRKRFSLEALQQHALSSAVVARGLVPDRGDGTDAFTACMLQDVGQLILAEQLPERFDEALSLAETEGVDAYAAEKRVFGASHAELGAYLLGTWGLPYPIVEAVANHHDPGRASTACFGVAEATHVAGVLVSGVDVRPDYLSAWGVDDQYAAWKDRARELLEKAGG